MGQKVNPVGLRLGINRTWDSRWFADGHEYGRLLHEDIKIRRQLKARLGQAGISRIIIERPHKKCRITIYAARPGVILGTSLERFGRSFALAARGSKTTTRTSLRPPSSASIRSRTWLQSRPPRPAGSTLPPPPSLTA